MKPKSEASFVDLPSRTELDLEDTIGGETGVVVVFSLLVFSLVNEIFSSLPIFVFISGFLHFLLKLPISGLSPEAIFM